MATAGGAGRMRSVLRHLLVPGPKRNALGLDQLLKDAPDLRVLDQSGDGQAPDSHRAVAEHAQPIASRIFEYLDRIDVVVGKLIHVAPGPTQSPNIGGRPA